MNTYHTDNMSRLYTLLCLGLCVAAVLAASNPCYPSPCQNGRCVVVEKYVYCLCPKGFNGPDCGRRIGERDPCDPNPCPNGAVCSVNGDDAHCTCPPGWAGKLCELKIDIYNCLERNPCLNKRSLEKHHFFYRHDDPESYVVCSEAGECDVQHCQAGMLWDQRNLQCAQL